MGPPGSGCASQAEIVAEKFGLVCINPINLVNEEIKTNKTMHARFEEEKKNGSEIPVDILISVIIKRMAETDCKVNGWVMSGFPINSEQLLNLKSKKITPTLVCEFDQSLKTSKLRLGNRRVDPMTGEKFNLG